jgi:bifunctional ADP-heptose synthase (sugar kinase/adenylyltransferase)
MSTPTVLKEAHPEIDLTHDLLQVEKRRHVAFRNGCDDILHESDVIAWTLHL